MSLDDSYEFETNPNHIEHILDDSWKTQKSEAYAEYRRMWEEVPANKQFIDFPIHIDIETTTRCNLKCPMCPRTVQMNEGVFDDFGFISKEDYKNIIDQAVAGGAKSIKLNYLGEPLLHKDVVWQVAYAKEKGIIDVMMNSNASALTEKNSRALLEAGLDNMFISMDSVNPRDFETQRVGTTLGHVIDNTYNFIKLKESIRPDCQIRLSMILYEDPKWAAQHEAMKIMWEGLVDAVNINHFVDRSNTINDEFPETEGFHCAQPFHRMFLKYNGNVTICCFDDRDEMPMGNWREQALHEVWNSSKYNDFRKIQADNNYYKVKMCRKCTIPTCSGK